MGITVDLIPRLPGEDPERAIARIYEGAVAIRWDSETESMTIGDLEDAAEGIDQAPQGAFDEWRAEVRRRLTDLHPWQTETEGPCTYLWSRNSVWRVEIDDGADSITASSKGLEP